MRCCVRIVGDLIDVAKIQRGALKLRIETTVQEMLPLAAKNEVEIKTSPEKNLPKVKADFDELRHVLLNLIDNAIKFNKNGEKSL